MLGWEGGEGHAIDNGARHTKNSKEAIKKRIKNSEEAILKLETHRQKQTCPKTLRCDAKAKIRANKEFKEEIKTIRKQAEQKLLGAPQEH